MKATCALGALLAAGALVGCMKQPLMQGNDLDPRQAARIVPGMTRAEVVDILGDPVYEDRMHRDRLVYLDLHEATDGRRVRRALIVRFDRSGRVVAIERKGIEGN